VVRGNGITGLFLLWQVRLGTHTALIGGSRTLLYLPSTCRIFVQPSECLCRLLLAGWCKACGRAGEYFLMEKYSCLNLSPLVSLLHSDAFAEHPPSVDRAAPCPRSACMVLSPPTLGRVCRHAGCRGERGRTAGPCPIQRVPAAARVSQQPPGRGKGTARVCPGAGSPALLTHL